MKKKHRLPFPILFEDDDVIVIEKPAGLLATHTKLVGRLARESQLTAENLLNDYVRKGQAKSKKRVWLVHRLDRETSGVMMFAKSEEIAEKFRADWASLTEKTYLARVEGLLEEESGTFESYLLEDTDGYRVRSVAAPDARRISRSARTPKLARTEWRRISTTDGTTLVEVKLKTGRKNQIRVHFSEAGHPVIGDEKYGGERASRLYLHALSLRFRHPRTGEWLEFTAPPPKGLTDP
jgi:tRNA pseudouridine32 synthase/23S rRNA pseudouridine746 synthase/23S rRNA pseudouridine1911/1915/1917 synthase